MNIEKISPAEVERGLAEVLQKLLSSATWLGGWIVKAKAPDVKDSRWDLIATGSIPGGKAALCVESKLHFQPSQFETLVDRPCQLKHYKIARVLAMPYISPRMASLCQEHGWGWFDLAGNCHIEIPGALLIDRSGREPVRVRERSGANLSTPEAGRVIRALLAPENAGKRWTQREVVAHFATLPIRIPAPSLGLVNKLVQYLNNQAFLEALTDRGFRVRDYQGLLQAWRQAYRPDLSVRQRYFTLLQGRALHDKLRTLALRKENQVAYAAFSAADFQAPHVRQPRTWLYLTAEMEGQFKAELEAKLVDSGENLVVMIPDDLGVFYQLDMNHNRLACTNAVQTYVDLSVAGGRGEEAAEAVLQQRLKPAVITAIKQPHFHRFCCWETAYGEDAVTYSTTVSKFSA